MIWLLRRALLGLGLALAVWASWQLGLFGRLRLIALDAGFAVRPSPPSPRDVILVGIEDKFTDTYGQPPWPRELYARTIDLLAANGAKVIGFDLYLEEPQDAEARAALAAGNQALAEAIARHGKVFFACYQMAAEGGAVAQMRPTRPYDRFLGDAVRAAHINLDLGARDDAHLRAMPIEIRARLGRERWLAMPLALAAAGRGHSPDDYSHDRENRAFVIGDMVTPISGLGPRPSFLLDLPRETITEQYLSLADLLEGNFRPEQIKDKVALVGLVMEGAQLERKDVFATPTGTKYGAVILAEATQQALDGRFLRTAPQRVTATIILLTGLLAPFFFNARRLASSLIFFAILMAAAAGVFLLAMAQWSYALEPAPIMATVLAAMVGSMVLSLGETRHELVRDAKALDLLRELGETMATATGMAALASGRRPDVSDSFLLPAQTPHVLLQSIGAAVGARRGALYLWRHDRGALTRAAAFGDAENAVAAATARRINERLTRERAPFAGTLSPRELAAHTAATPRTLLAMPLMVKGQILGAVHLYDKRPTEVSPARHYTSGDLRLVATMAQQTLVGLENASLYEGMRDIFLNATLALANAVDAKDPYTHGHSERVLRFSELMARAMGLTERDVEITKMSAVLHDIGKIAIPDEILRKPGKLTKAEYDVIKTHPARGETIIAPLEELRPLIPGIRHHHEQFNGNGYPDGLSGTDIPLYARIICVADSYDAMTSARFYRPARSQKEALDEIERCAGSQFDPEIAARLIEVVTSPPPEA